MLRNSVFKEETILGLGDMGAVLAKVLLKNGRQVTVWNRSTSKAESLIQKGAVLATSVAAAVSSSLISVICVANYSVTRSILNATEVIPILAGRILVELSIGTPHHARDGESWAHKHGAFVRQHYPCNPYPGWQTRDSNLMWM
ncbi:NAD(P)-binding protein [Basidiobolus meristosporus CBS 931.73]|uniref:NAD(P)-binding protein n=1 Tax=Basidiobolus meristosporus CBS 931.73 TaxID=1314790 RepID=A0A1Y1Y133_9FUNG|nr:NAD(P)-binding protein [Basidiobolus meristosporus CBS 931.73]|eukprot:ORX91669.1 NAD(P)-binding protein [Basidiobolus meristosporus CBS 931.73]